MPSLTTSPFVGATSLVFCFVAACGNVSNQAERERPIYDLSDYALTAASPPGPGTYRVAEITQTSSASAIRSLFMKDGHLWTFNVDGTRARLSFQRLNAEGGVEEEYTPAWSIQDPIWAATADDAGTIWVETGDGIAEFDPVTETYGRRVAGSYLPQATLAAAGEFMYRGGQQTLLRLSLSTGLVVDDLSPTLKTAFGQEDGWAIGAIGVNDDEIIVKMRYGSTDAIVLDRQTGAFVGYAGDVPTGIDGDFAGSALVGSGAGWIGVGAPGTLVTFSLSSPLPMAEIASVSALEQSGARAITFARGEIWVLYVAQDGRLSMVAYDPNTQAPTQGFAIAPEVAAELYVPDDAIEPYAVTFQGDELYIASTSPYVGEETRVRVIDYATGAMTRSFNVPEILTGLCHDGNALWGAKAPGGYAAPPLHVPAIHRLDVETGLAEGESFEAPYALSGWPVLICMDSGVSLSTETTRQWLTFSEPSASSSNSSTVVRHAFLIPSAGASGAMVGDDLWMLDRTRNLLFQTSLPAPLAR
ncbi:MAG: hypothetical protein H6729_14445 [Deltaproteobacteria bacterium]|nr:hypothetical protein [Deltaproteobacteria bacterium]